MKIKICRKCENEFKEYTRFQNRKNYDYYYEPNLCETCFDTLIMLLKKKTSLQCMRDKTLMKYIEHFNIKLHESKGHYKKRETL
jgi:hypothetical protein